jgi:hypothetical protein
MSKLSKTTSLGVNISSFTSTPFSPQVNGELTEDLSNKSGNEIISSVWKVNPNIAKEITNINKVYSSKFGLFASIPMICKADDCQFKDVCMVNHNERVEGRRCPMEISAILSRFEMWCSHFNIDTSMDFIDPKDIVDVSLIKDLVNIEIQIIRAENKIALNGDFMQTVLVEVDKRCNAYYSEDIHPATRFIMDLQNRKDRILNQLHSTRKDLAGDMKKNSPTDDAIKLFKQIREIEKSSDSFKNMDITDVEFDADGNIIQTVEAEELTQEDKEKEIKEQTDSILETIKENSEEQEDDGI